MIRVLIVDDHPAVRNGLLNALRSEPGLVPIAMTGRMSSALVEARRSHPDVVLVDYQLPDGDGLILSHELKQLEDVPSVLLYSAFAGRALAVAARVAGADGMINKGATLSELFKAIRGVARGDTAPPVPPPHVLEKIVARLDDEDLPIFGMRMDATSVSEIAAVLQMPEAEVSGRLAAMLKRLAG